MGVQPHNAGSSYPYVIPRDLEELQYAAALRRGASVQRPEPDNPGGTHSTQQAGDGARQPRAQQEPRQGSASTVKRWDGFPLPAPHLRLLLQLHPEGLDWMGDVFYLARGLSRVAAGNPRFPRLLPGILGNFPGCL